MTDRLGQRHASGFAVFTLVIVALFVGLGVWQLQRRVEKHALIAALNERLAAAPVPLPHPSQWPALTSEKDEFRRVSFAATYESRLDAVVYSSGTAMRNDISGPGGWAFIPARLPTGETVAVNAGFVPNTIQDRNQQDRVMAQLITNMPVTLTGYVRFPVAAGSFTPDVEHAKRLWFTRDHLAMAQALGSDRVAPFYIDLEAPVPPSGIPKPGPLQVHLPDDHMQYAITWFSLAGLVLIALFLLRGRMPARRHLSIRPSTHPSDRLETDRRAAFAAIANSLWVADAAALSSCELQHEAPCQPCIASGTSARIAGQARRRRLTR